MNLKEEKNKILSKKFVLFVLKELKIDKAPKIYLQNGRGNIKTTASYSYDIEKDICIIRVNCENRALIDCLRSLAHELVHHKQYEKGLFNSGKPKDIGGEIEDEANAKAGQFIKLFSLENEDLYVF
jgi:Zn-dependent peptidase ImmA (M78 family)